MCDKTRDGDSETKARIAQAFSEQAKILNPIEHHLVYELKQRRERILAQLVSIQNAIDAVNRAV